MEISAINAGLGVTVTRGSEGTNAAEHADGSVVYYVTKTAAATTLKGDIDTAVTTLPIFSISNFDANDIIKIENEFLRVTAVNSALVGQATVTFSQPKTIAAASGQGFEMRLNYSQVRLTSHDFLNVGTGTKTTTNWLTNLYKMQINSTKFMKTSQVVFIMSPLTKMVTSVLVNSSRLSRQLVVQHSMLTHST